MPKQGDICPDAPGSSGRRRDCGPAVDEGSSGSQAGFDCELVGPDEWGAATFNDDGPRV